MKEIECTLCNGCGYETILEGYEKDGSPIIDRDICKECNGKGNFESEFLE